MGTSLFCQSFEVHKGEVRKTKCRLTFPSQFQFDTKVSRWNGFCILCKFQFFERETLLLFLMNLLTGPVLALRCSQFKVSTYHSSQLTEHEICRKHYKELEQNNRTCFSSFCDDTTENKQRPQKCPEFIWKKLDGIIGFDKYPESHSPGEKFSNLTWKRPYSVSEASNSFLWLCLERSFRNWIHKCIENCCHFVSFRKVLFLLESISFFQLATDIHQGEIENLAEADIEMTEIDDETDKGDWTE